jgi:hypothetical protein
MKNSISWDVTSRSPLKVYRRFGGTCRLLLHGRRTSQEKTQRVTGSKQNSTETSVDLQRITQQISQKTALLNYSDINIHYIYDYITKLCRQQAEVIPNLENENVRDIGKGGARHRKYKKLQLRGGQA